MPDYLHERGNGISEAYQRWSQVIADHQIECIKKDCNANGFSSRLCYLKAGDLTARGAGKGRNASEIDISASYEALEYFLSGCNFHSYPYLVESTKEISKKYPLMLQRCNVELFLSDANKDFPIPWVIYEDISNTEQYAVPLASVDLSYGLSRLENDTFNYEACGLYSSSNGLASGSCYEESVIHSALEILERDAYSYFLIDTYILKKPPSVINKETLPADLLILVNSIESNYANRVVLLKMPSRFGVHVYMATLADNVFEVQPRGSGASLDAKYALERAIHELIQSYNLLHHYYLENDINPERLGNNALIKDFFHFDVSETVANNYHHNIDFCYNSDIVLRLTLPEYLDKLVELIHAQSSSLLVNVVYKNKNGLTCTRAIIPEVEEFFLATHYAKLTPKTKTASYIAERLGKEFNWQDYIN